MKKVYKKKDSFLEKSFLNNVESSFIQNIQKLRSNEIYTKKFDKYKLEIIDRAISDCVNQLLNKKSDFNIKNNSLAEIKTLPKNKILDYLFHRYRYEIFPDKKIIDDIKITSVEYADQVIKTALTKELKPTEWVEVDISKKDDKSQASIQ